MEIVLGCTVEDRLTGFRGIVTGIVHYISGCNQALVTPRVSESGARIEPEWCDLQRLEVDLQQGIVQLDNGETPGFDRAPPKR